MMNLETSLKRPSPIILKWLPILFIALSFLGFSDATYLTAKHYLGSPVTCIIFEGCEKVTTSPYSIVFGVPVALLGALYYAAILILAVAYWDSKRIGILKLLAVITPAGFLASLWFVYLQLFVIKAICFYCIVSAATSTALFGLGIYALRVMKVFLDASSKLDLLEK